MRADMPCHITDGPSDPEDADDRWRTEDRWLELERISDYDYDRAQAARCVVCNVEWVDVLHGEDTCAGCLSRV